MHAMNQDIPLKKITVQRQAFLSPEFIALVAVVMGANEGKWRKALSEHGMFSELREVLSPPLSK